MSTVNHSYERCRSFIDSNFVEDQPHPNKTAMSVAISRQAFSHTHAIAEELIRLLRDDPKIGYEGWALFDRDLVHQILDDHNLPDRLAEYMPEDRDRDFTGLINEILGLHPSSWKLFHYTCDTIYKLAKVGNVVLIGRGAHVITRNMPQVLKIRIIAPFDRRVYRAAKLRGIPTEEARKNLRPADAARAAFVRSHFDEDLNDPLAYDLTINTGRMSDKAAARLILSALHGR
jgi:hypothetical protein